MRIVPDSTLDARRLPFDARRSTLDEESSVFLEVFP
jgi:hypothetical protein